MSGGTEKPPFKGARDLGLTGLCHHSSALEGVVTLFKRKDREEIKDVDSHEDAFEVSTQRGQGVTRGRGELEPWHVS